MPQLQFDPSGTLLRAAGLSLLLGVGWAAAAVVAITLISGGARASLATVWRSWPRRRPGWLLLLALSLAGTLYTSDRVCRAVAFADLYWASRTEAILRICYLGALCGYLFLLLLFVVLSLHASRRAARRQSAALTAPDP